MPHDDMTHEELASAYRNYTPDDTELDPEDSGTTLQCEQKSVSTILVELACDKFYFGVSPEGEPFSVPRNGPKVVRLLRGGQRSLRSQLARDYFEMAHKAPSQQALTDALYCIQGTAESEELCDLYQRVARHDGAIWLDLGDTTGRAVKITGRGWSVEEYPPVFFRRTTLNGALPTPAKDGDLDDLWDWINVTKEDRALVISWLVACLFCDIPHPVLGLFGEQGTGKTTIEKILVSMLDPGPVPTRKAPRDADSWITAASGSWIVGLDNLSDITPWLSDSLCRAVTGDGDVRRKLYTDGELKVFSFRRCAIINGIDLGALRGDLAERVLPINLDVITEEQRREEEDYWPAWNEVHPRLLGGLLNLAVRVIAALSSIRLHRKPRMADFARIVAAVDKQLGTDGLERYRAKQGEIASDSLSGDSFIVAVMESIDTFQGKASELLEQVSPKDDKRPPKGWPTDARVVTQRLKRNAPAMRGAGWHIESDDARNHEGVIQWTIARPSRDKAEKSSPPSPRSQQYEQKGPESAGTAGTAGVNSRLSHPPSARQQVKAELWRACDGTDVDPRDVWEAMEREGSIEEAADDPDVVRRYVDSASIPF